mmetsp:Transcript_19913/g.75248  ORF Transcript_19913/g.75248 Transcript_19913/m.75248 type:complete len:86 (+) Transcript_19913:267-524(+)
MDGAGCPVEKRRIEDKRAHIRLLEPVGLLDSVRGSRREQREAHKWPSCHGRKTSMTVAGAFDDRQMVMMMMMMMMMKEQERAKLR